jgi:hypothetical protein
MNNCFHVHFTIIKFHVSHIVTGGPRRQLSSDNSQEQGLARIRNEAQVLQEPGLSVV